MMLVRCSKPLSNEPMKLSAFGLTRRSLSCEGPETLLPNYYHLSTPGEWE